MRRRVQNLALIDQVVAAHVVLYEYVRLVQIVFIVHGDVLAIDEGNVIAARTLGHQLGLAVKRTVQLHQLAGVQA